MSIDEKKFVDFENSRVMNGKKRKYFSREVSKVGNPKRLKNKLYVEVNQSANSLRNLLIKLLKAYGFNLSDYKVYLRADLFVVK